MLYHLLYALRGELSLLNVTRYITFRTAVASLTALLLVLVLGPWMIERLRRLQIGQYIREEGPQAHKAKAGTPTMGGVLILVGILVPTLLWADLTNRNIWIVILATLAFGAVGFADDYIKVVKKRSLGLTARRKLFWQFAIGLAVGLSVYLLAQVEPKEYSTRIVFPFFKQVVPDLGLLYIVFAVLLLTLSSNAVNLTDGLDGLAIGTTLIAAAAFTVLAYVSGHRRFSDYLDLLYRPGAGEITVFCGAMVGASMGFLWWNCYPAQVFMGDVGSLALGGALGTVAHPDQAGAAAVLRGRPLHGRGLLRDPAGRLVPPHRQARLPHVAAPPPLRAGGLEGAADHHPVLDRRLHLRAVQPHDPEAAVRAPWREASVVVIGLARSGVAAASFLARRGATVVAADRRRSPSCRRRPWPCAQRASGSSSGSTGRRRSPGPRWSSCRRACRGSCPSSRRRARRACP